MRSLDRIRRSLDLDRRAGRRVARRLSELPRDRAERWFDTLRLAAGLETIYGGFDDHKNLSTSTVATPPSPPSSGTSLVLAAGGAALMPAAPFDLTIRPAGSMATPANAEVARCTNVNVGTDTLTITRAQYGTAARTVLTGDVAFAGVTDQMLDALEAIAVLAVTGDLAGNLPSPTVKQATNAFALTGDISPTQLTANQNDYNPTSLSTSTRLRLTSDANRSVTGLQGGADGRVIVIHNVGSNPITLVDESASSTAGNRFALGGAGSSTPSSIVLAGGDGVILIYDATSSRWRPASVQAVMVTADNDLAADVTMTTSGTFYDGPSVSLAAGTWLVVGSVIVYKSGAIVTATGKLWDGTTVESSTQGTSANGKPVQLSLFGILVLAATTTIKISATSTASTSILAAATLDSGAGNNAGHLRAFKLGR